MATSRPGVGHGNTQVAEHSVVGVGGYGKVPALTPPDDRAWQGEAHSPELGVPGMASLALDWIPGDGPMRILLAEDDALIGDGVRAGLRLAGFAVDWVRDGEAARLALLGQKYDACVLDLGLPRRDGLSVLRDLRGRDASLPVLILTARDTRNDKVSGLDAGADDYLTKPFDLEELQARLRALLRRSGGGGGPELVHGEVRLDPAGKRVTLAGRPVALSAREYALLHDLLAHKGRIRSKADLEESLYAWGEETESNTVEVYIHHLRKKLGMEFIRTVRGMGYCVGGA